MQDAHLKSFRIFTRTYAGSKSGSSPKNGYTKTKLENYKK